MGDQGRLKAIREKAKKEAENLFKEKPKDVQKELKRDVYFG
jgi:F0F1-type ATP synthase membrane subunit b/b'